MNIYTANKKWEQIYKTADYFYRMGYLSPYKKDKAKEIIEKLKDLIEKEF